MQTQHRERQAATALVDVATWTPDENYPPVFPVGSKPKRLVICPDPAPHPFLIAGHRYLFKVAEGWQVLQSWSEVIAYELARYAPITVAPCFAACDSSTGKFGALVEFFYGYPGDEAPPRFVHGSDVLQRFLGRAVFDPSADRPHDWETNIRLCEQYGVPDAATWWGETLAFDTIIGNTDRHPQNWGLLNRPPNRHLSPIFDNGTSLAYEQTEDALTGRWPKARLDAYIRRGAHHCSVPGANQGCQHADLCQVVSRANAAAGAAARKVILLSDSQIVGVVSWCATFQAPVPFTERRAEFVAELVQARRDHLVRSLDA